MQPKSYMYLHVRYVKIFFVHVMRLFKKKDKIIQYSHFYVIIIGKMYLFLFGIHYRTNLSKISFDEI